METGPWEIKAHGSGQKNIILRKMWKNCSRKKTSEKTSEEKQHVDHEEWRQSMNQHTSPDYDNPI